MIFLMAIALVTITITLAVFLLQDKCPHCGKKLKYVSIDKSTWKVICPHCGKEID